MGEGDFDRIGGLLDEDDEDDEEELDLLALLGMTSVDASFMLGFSITMISSSMSSSMSSSLSSESNERDAAARISASSLSSSRNFSFLFSSSLTFLIFRDAIKENSRASIAISNVARSSMHASQERKTDMFKNTGLIDVIVDADADVVIVVEDEEDFGNFSGDSRES